MKLSKLSNIIPISTKLVRPQYKNIPQIADSVEIAGARFSPLELQLMEDIRRYGIDTNLETACVIDKKGKLLDLDVIESAGSTSIMSKEGFKFLGMDIGLGPIGHLLELQRQVLKGTFIHNHPAEVPLSGTDVNVMLTLRLKKMIATTPGGGFSYLKRPDNSNFIIPDIKCIKAATELANAQYKKLKELGMIMEIDSIPKADFTDPKKTKAYSDFSIKKLEEFARRFGFEFKHQLN